MFFISDRQSIQGTLHNCSPQGGGCFVNGFLHLFIWSLWKYNMYLWSPNHSVQPYYYYYILHQYSYTTSSTQPRVLISAAVLIVLCFSRVRAGLWGRLVSACGEIATALPRHSSLAPFGNLTVRTKKLNVVTHIWLLWPLPQTDLLLLILALSEKEDDSVLLSRIGQHGPVLSHTTAAASFYPQRTPHSLVAEYQMRAIFLRMTFWLWSVWGDSWQRPFSVLAPMAGSGKNKDLCNLLDRNHSTQVLSTFFDNKA